MGVRSISALTIIYEQTKDLEKSAELTYSNMRSYYEQLAVQWDSSTILSQISELENLDIVKNGETIGAIRLSMIENACWLRDLQVSREFQNMGIGSKAIEKVTAIARESETDLIKLRVFKISPASRLYIREGFKQVEEDEKFYYMDKNS